jgi:hypothetical protein
MSFRKGSILAKLHSYGLIDSDITGENGLIAVHVDAQEGLLG